MWSVRRRQPPLTRVDPSRLGGMNWAERRVVNNRRRVIDVDTFRRWHRRRAMQEPEPRVRWMNLALALIAVLALVAFYRASHPGGRGRPPSHPGKARPIASASPIDAPARGLAPLG